MGKIWTTAFSHRKERNFELLISLLVLQFAALLLLFSRIFGDTDSACLICDFFLFIAASLAIIFHLRSKFNSALNLFFTVPFFVYGYYISDYTLHLTSPDTIYLSAFWLLAGAFFLLYFSETDSKPLLYSAISIFTIGLHIIKARQNFEYQSITNASLPHPILVFVLIFAAGFFVRLKFFNRAQRLQEKLKSTKYSVSKVIGESGFPIAEIKAERDDEGNIEELVIEKINTSFESLFNIRLAEVKGQEANFIFSLALRDNFDLNNLLLTNRFVANEFYAPKLEIWLKFNVLRPEDNTFFIILEDITKEKKHQENLESNKQRYKALLEAIPDMFFVIGKDGIYEDFVVKESDLFKLEEANIVGSSIFDVGFPKNMAKKIMKCIQSCINNNSIEIIEYSLQTPNGTYLFEMRLAKLNAHSVISVARDITRRKNAEFNLERAKKKAEESDRLKSAFLTNLSHEIRTPLNIIINFTRMLAESELANPDRLELSDAISQNGRQLLNMIDNTIHLSKIETDTVDVSMRFCPVNTVMRDIFNKHRIHIPDTRQVKMFMNLDVPNSTFGFTTDQRLLSETLSILVDNAVKYTNSGEIHLSYEMLGTDAIRFKISDTGIGISQEEMDNIFIRFYRVKNSINEMTSGSGIGLSIAQHYVQLLGGELKLESTPDVGTTFIFDLPFMEGRGYLRIVS
ncbi:MAG: PAS domain-containing sensor histidine kinase [Mariniphaga sp.]